LLRDTEIGGRHAVRSLVYGQSGSGGGAAAPDAGPSRVSGEASSAIRAIGRLRDEASGEGVGGLWLVDAESSEAVRALVEADLFWPTELRSTVRVLAWTQVFADGRRMITLQDHTLQSH
jgi:hypothetical protein